MSSGRNLNPEYTFFLNRVFWWMIGQNRNWSLGNKPACLTGGHTRTEQEPGERSLWETCSQQVYLNEHLVFLCIFKGSSWGSSWIQGFQLLLLMGGEAILGHRNVLKEQITTLLLYLGEKTVTLLYESKMWSFPIEHPDLQEHVTHFLKEIKKAEYFPMTQHVLQQLKSQ